jgi:tRNA modification GTPase
MDLTTTICALSTPPGMGAIAVIRVSGPDALAILSGLFYRNKQTVDLSQVRPYSMHYGNLMQQGELIDEVMLAVFKGPKSYTGEDTVEINCHGSIFIQQRILEALINSGAHPAAPGEFSMRAFVNGKMDLSQAEAVADLIFSESAAAHKLAVNQMRGGFSKRLTELREQLIHFAALLELELDFAEEDVEFANREDLLHLLATIHQEVERLAASFAVGNVLKNGIPVTIAGPPNAGKSTLLNALLQEDKAIVSDVAGTTRDAIEDEIVLEGVRFRFIDTAGIRDTTDVVEAIGIQKTYEKINQAHMVILLYDHAANPECPPAFLEVIAKFPDKKFILVANKTDATSTDLPQPIRPDIPTVGISAKTQLGLDRLTNELVASSGVGTWQQADIIVTNVRHQQALHQAGSALQEARLGLKEGLSGDLVAFHLRDALKALGEITGSIDVDRDILGTIFGKFCIGK